MSDYYGWIKIHRQLKNHWLYKIDGEYSKFQAWCDLLINANFKQTKIVIRDTVITLEIGQQARSVLTLSKEWKWSKNKVLRFLDLLKNDSMIDTKTNHLTTIITICNYSSFQLGDTTGETPNDTTGDTTGETQYKKDKKDKNDLPKKNDDAQPATQDSLAEEKPELMGTLPCQGGEYEVLEDFWDKLALAYPTKDLGLEFRRMKLWLEANPTRLKTKKGMPKFINNWLSK